MEQFSGIFYPKGSGGGGGGGTVNSVSGLSTPTLNLSSSGTTNVVISGGVNISTVTGNTIVAKPDGLYSPSSSGSSVKMPIKTVSANYSLTISDGVILVNAASGNVVISALAPATAVGIVYTVKKIDSSANTVTVLPASGNIEFGSSAVLTSKGQSIDFISDSNNYYIK